MGSTKMQDLLSVTMKFLPPGFRFHPTDEEVVDNYLAGGGSQEFVVIPEIDICKFEPEMLPIQFKEKSMIQSNDPEWWFLCKQEHGQKVRRSTGEGYWKITGKPSEVKSSDTNQVIGSKRFLMFYRKVQASKDIKSNWVMHEYCLPDDGNRSSSVICHVIKRKADDKAVSRPSFSVPHTEPQSYVNQINGSDFTTQASGSRSISGPSVSSRSESIDLMDSLEDSEHEHCNFSEDQIQMTMKSLLSSFETPNGIFSQHSLIGDGDSAVMDFSSPNEDQDSRFNVSAGSEKQDFLNDICGIDDQILNQFGGTVEIQNSRREAANIRESTQTQTMKPGKAQPMYILESSPPIYLTGESQLEGCGENSVPVNFAVSKRSGKFHDESTKYEDSARCRNRKIKMETEASKTKEKEVKKHGTDTDRVKKIGSAASSCLVLERSKNSGQETRLNCKTESRSCSCDNVLSVEDSFASRIIFLVGILLVIFFLAQVC